LIDSSFRWPSRASRLRYVQLRRRFGNAAIRNWVYFLVCWQFLFSGNNWLMVMTGLFLGRAIAKTAFWCRYDKELTWKDFYGYRS